jgi:hypothetical protein
MVYLASLALLLSASAAALIIIPHIRTRRAVRARLHAISKGF